MAYLYVYNYIGYAFPIIAFMLSTLLVHYEFKEYQITIKQVILLLESELPHQYDFNKFQ